MQQVPFKSVKSKSDATWGIFDSIFGPNWHLDYSFCLRCNMDQSQFSTAERIVWMESHDRKTH